MPSSRRPSRSRDRTRVFRIAGRFFTVWDTRVATVSQYANKWNQTPYLATYVTNDHNLNYLYHVRYNTGCLTVLEFKVQNRITGLKASCPQGWSLSGAAEDSLFFAFFLILAAVCIPWLLAASPVFIANGTASFTFFPLSHYFCWHITFSSSVAESLPEIYRYPLLTVSWEHLYRVHLGFTQVIRDNLPISTCSHVENPFYHKK